MNERLFRTQFNQMETTEKQALMESLATRYDMTFLGLHTFDRWGQSSTTGIFEKDGREYVFVPGDTVTLGWERFAIGLSQDSREELDYLFQEWEMEQDPEEMIRESMAPVRQAAIGPMLVGRELEELCWELVTMDDPRLTAHPDWLKQFREFAWSDLDSLTMHQSARIERTEKGFQICIYNRTDYDELLAGLEKQGLSLPTADEWVSITALITMNSLPGWKSRGFRCLQRTSGPICAAEGAAPCSPGGMEWTTPCTCTTSKAQRMRTSPSIWRSPTSSECPSPMTPICGRS